MTNDLFHCARPCCIATGSSQPSTLFCDTTSLVPKSTVIILGLHINSSFSRMSFITRSHSTTAATLKFLRSPLSIFKMQKQQQQQSPVIGKSFLSFNPGNYTLLGIKYVALRLSNFVSKILNCVINVLVLLFEILSFYTQKLLHFSEPYLFICDLRLYCLYFYIMWLTFTSPPKKQILHV